MSDTWSKTDAALRALNKLFVQLHDTKPAKGSKEEKAWEEELAEARRWSIEVHERRISLNMRKIQDVPCGDCVVKIGDKEPPELFCRLIKANEV